MCQYERWGAARCYARGLAERVRQKTGDNPYTLPRPLSSSANGFLDYGMEQQAHRTELLRRQYRRVHPLAIRPAMKTQRLAPSLAIICLLVLCGCQTQANSLWIEAGSTADSLVF